MIQCLCSEYERPSADWLKPGFDDSGWTEGKGGFGSPGTPRAVISRSRRANGARSDQGQRRQGIDSWQSCNNAISMRIKTVLLMLLVLTVVLLQGCVILNP